MLGIGKLAAGAEDYYLGIAAGIEDYYVGIASPGQWIGSSQQLLGLSGEIDPDTLRTVFAGLDPATGAPLLNSANRTVMAFDLTFKADKSVSLLHAFGTTEVAANGAASLMQVCVFISDWRGARQGRGTSLRAWKTGEWLQ